MLGDAVERAAAAQDRPRRQADHLALGEQAAQRLEGEGRFDEARETFQQAQAAAPWKRSGDRLDQGGAIRDSMVLLFRNKSHEMIPLLEVMMLTKTRQQWMDELEAAGVPCGPINTLADTFDNPQVRARELKIELPHPTAGKVPLVANPIKYSGTPLEYVAPPPLLGEHTEAVLRELGYAPEQIERLRASHIV